MKNVTSYFNRKSENRTFDAFAKLALNKQLMNLVLGGGDPQTGDEFYVALPPNQN